MKLLFWNIQFLPFGITWRNAERAVFMAKILVQNHPDVICLCEAYDRKATEIIASDLRKYGYVYQQHTGLTGGLFIACKQRIIYSKFVRFSHSGYGLDRLGRKGFLIVRLDSVYIILTHVQAGEGTSEARVRQKQIMDIEKYTSRILLFDSTPAVVVGDLNCDTRREFSTSSYWSLPRLHLSTCCTSFSKTNPLVDRTDSWLTTQTKLDYSSIIVDWAITPSNNPVSNLSMYVHEGKINSYISLLKGIFMFGTNVHTNYASDHNIIQVSFNEKRET